MKNFIIICLFLFILLNNSNAEVIAEKDIYLVKDVCIEMFDINPIDARSNAFQQAKEHALSLILSHLSRQDISLSNEQIDSTIQEYEIIEETLFKNQKYKICLNIISNKNVIKQIIANYDLQEREKQIYGNSKVNMIILTDGKINKWTEIDEILMKNNINYIVKYLDNNKIVIMFDNISIEKLIQRINQTSKLEVVKNGNEYFLNKL
jgi:hypothetical protein